MPRAIENFTSIWCVVCVANARRGEQLRPVIVAAEQIACDATMPAELPLQIGMPKLATVRRPPYPTGSHALIVTIDAQMLASCHLALGWRLPERMIDLLVEHRNGRQAIGAMIGGFAGALAAQGIPTSRAVTGGSTPAELRRRLDAITRLFGSLREALDLGRALLRGRYLCAVAQIEAVGVPIDRELLATLSAQWPSALAKVIAAVDAGFGIYSGQRLDVQAFDAFLERQEIDWPRLATGALDLGDETFREMFRLHPQLCPLKELRSTLNGFDPRQLAVGRDGRNRVLLRPFASRTGRNQPSTKASVLGSAAWVRRLIRPELGTGLAMIDWQQQEFGIAAALSGDRAMQAAYCSGDPYWAFAVASRAVSASATAEAHQDIRERFKRCALGVQYGVGKGRLAQQLGTAESIAADMIGSHKSAYRRFWEWLDGVETCALIDREVRSVFGWRLPVHAESNPRSIRNFPMQANGAEMLRLACCSMTEAGMRVCTTNHDAVLIEVPATQLDDAVVEAQRLMADASAIVLDGFALRTSVRTVRAPNRWSEPRGHHVWAAIGAALGTCSRT